MRITTCGTVRSTGIRGCAGRPACSAATACRPTTWPRRAAATCATVHVEAGWAAGDPFAELAWLDQLQRPAGLAARYVARATLDAADAEATLERLAAQPRVAGVRDILSWHPEPRRSFCADRHRMSSPAWRAGFAALDRHGLSFDLMISPWQMAEARQLAQAFPATRFALNHCGSPFDQSEDGLAHWQQGLRRLAELPNVEIKISDVVAYQPGWSAQTSAASC